MFNDFLFFIQLFLVDAPPLIKNIGKNGLHNLPAKSNE